MTLKLCDFLSPVIVYDDKGTFNDIKGRMLGAFNARWAINFMAENLIRFLLQLTTLCKNFRRQQVV
jgi:hypothetical protein